MGCIQDLALFRVRSGRFAPLSGIGTRLIAITQHSLTVKVKSHGRGGSHILSVLREGYDLIFAGLPTCGPDRRGSWLQRKWTRQRRIARRVFGRVLIAHRWAEIDEGPRSINASTVACETCIRERRASHYSL